MQANAEQKEVILRALENQHRNTWNMVCCTKQTVRNLMNHATRLLVECSSEVDLVDMAGSCLRNIESLQTVFHLAQDAGCDIDVITEGQIEVMYKDAQAFYYEVRRFQEASEDAFIRALEEDYMNRSDAELEAMMEAGSYGNC